MSGDAELAAFVRRLRDLKSLASVAAQEAAPLVERTLRETASAGTDPDGKLWPPKRDGARALPNAANAITAVAKGAAVVVLLTGAYVYHHFSKGKDRRRIIPDGGSGVPSRVAGALRAAATRAFERVMGR